jgi:uncharacterized membrane protein required for colicin V production
MLAGFNNLDFALLLLLFIGMLIGMIRGALSQTVSAVSIWLGLVATLWLYKVFSFRILQGLGLARIGADTLAFFILLIVFFNAFRLLVRYLTKPPEEKKKRKKDKDDPLAEAAKSATERFVIGPLNAIGGMAMGFVLTTLWMAIILGVLQFILQDALFEAGVPRPGLARELRQSFLVASYFNQVLWYLSQSVDFFVPRNADIFKTVLAQILGTTGG